jgi:thiol:disulfide interchange protein
MKNFKLIITAILMSVSFTATAQTESKVIALVTKANWCSICKANGERTIGNFTKNNEDNFFSLVANDVTDKSTKKASLPSLKKVGVDKIASSHPGTGVITFIDAKSKKILMQLTVANTDDELTYVMGEVRKLIKG